VSDTFSAFDQLIDENLGEFPNIDITGTGALTCDIIDEDLEATLGFSTYMLNFFNYQFDFLFHYSLKI
jgi:hypothetical protein